MTSFTFLSLYQNLVCNRFFYSFSIWHYADVLWLLD